MCNKFTIYGERCSGTNYLEELMLKNFDINVTWDYGWKHYFGHRNLQNTKDVNTTLFLGIVRDPISWINSFYKEQHHVGGSRRNIKAFLLNRFYSVHPDNSVHLEDLNYVTKKMYRNIFEMRFYKNFYLINIMPKKVKNYSLITYKNLKKNTHEILNMLQEKHNLKKKFPFYQNITHYKKNTGKTFYEKEISLPKFAIDIIKKYVFIPQENKLGYTII